MTAAPPSLAARARPGPARGPLAPPRRAQHLARSCEGSTAIEFGILALPFLLLVAGIMDCSRLVWTHLALQVAVEQAARCAVVDATTCGTAAQVQAYAASVMQAPGATAGTFSYAVAACGSQVSATLNFAVIVPAYLPPTITLTAQSCAPA